MSTEIAAETPQEEQRTTTFDFTHRCTYQNALAADEMTAFQADFLAVFGLDAFDTDVIYSAASALYNDLAMEAEMCAIVDAMWEDMSGALPKKEPMACFLMLFTSDYLQWVVPYLATIYAGECAAEVRQICRIQCFSDLMEKIRFSGGEDAADIDAAK